MSGDLLVTNAGELWTCASPGPLRGQALSGLCPSDFDAVAIRDGCVVEIASTVDLRSRHPGVEELSAGGRLVTPGLVDPHTHVIFAGDRSDEFARRCAGESYQEIAAKGGGIMKSVRATRGASAAELADLARPRLETMLLHGTTTAEVKTGYALDLHGEVAMLDAIQRANAAHPIELIPTFMGGHLPPTDTDRHRYVQLLCEKMIPMAVGKARFNDVFCDEGAFTLEESRLILEAGLECGLLPKIHAEEFLNTGAARLGVELGAVSVDHLLQANDQDIAALAGSDTVAVLLPGTGFYLDLPQRAPARRMIDTGCVVALGTDFNPGSCRICSMPFVMGLGALHLKMTATEVLGAATVNAATAIGLSASHGQLSQGFVGDLAIWNAFSLEGMVGNFVQAKADIVVKKGKAFLTI